MSDDLDEYILSRFDEVMEFRTSLRNETDRGCALMAAEYLSDQLGELLRARFVDDAKAAGSVLDDPNGSLGSFSSRIEFAYLLGYIGPVAKRELHLVRKIRNEFAHDFKPLTFADQHIASRCDELKQHSLVPDKLPRAQFTRTVMGLLATIHARRRSATHAPVSTDALSGLTHEQLAAANEDVKRAAGAWMEALGLAKAAEIEKLRVEGE